ncbi:hypothetical protein AAF712_007265 [Marasmius tenuissimus]|uniref:Uncharacterized protein n=1 Tax=Marasmius tenuissimus TaxID=585030 RepID=A0ABR2ZVR7_9AGAR
MSACPSLRTSARRIGIKSKEVDRPATNTLIQQSQQPPEDSNKNLSFIHTFLNTMFALQTSTTLISMATLLVLTGRVSAIPFPELARGLPSDVTHVAIDEDTSHYLAFKRDGSLHARYPIEVDTGMNISAIGARAAPTCSALSIDDVKKLAGWPAIEKYANDNWGTKSRKVLTNAKEYPANPALLCVTNEVIPVQTTGYNCQTHQISSHGTLMGTSGKASLSVEQGLSSESSYTVTKSTSIGVSNTVSVQLGVPEIASVTEAFTLSMDVTDTTAHSFGQTYEDKSTVQVDVEAPEGKTCKAVASSKTCQIQAKGSIRYIANGWVWFNYDSRTNGHYKWAASIDAIITNINDRSDYLDFQGSIQANTDFDYHGECV